MKPAIVIALLIFAANAHGQVIELKAFTKDGKSLRSNGVSIGTDRVVTCAHCIAFDEKCEIYSGLKSLKLLSLDRHVALLSYKLSTRSCLLSKSVPSTREKLKQVYVKDGESHQRDIVWVNKNKVKAVNPIWMKLRACQDVTESPHVFIPGMSGSGIFNESNELVAIVQDVDGGVWNTDDIRKLMDSK